MPSSTHLRKTVSTNSVHVCCVGAVSMINLLNQMSFSNHIYCNHECQTNILDEGNILSDKSCWWYWISPPRAWAAGILWRYGLEPNVALWQPVGQIVHPGPVIKWSSITQHCMQHCYGLSFECVPTQTCLSIDDNDTNYSHDDVIKWEHFPRYWPFVWGNSPVIGEFPTQRPVTPSFDVFFDLHLNKRLCKHS